MRGGTLTLTWDAVPGARGYRVTRSTSHDPATVVGFGLTTARFVEPAPAVGEVWTYTVVAVGVDGVSQVSSPVTVAPTRGPRPKVED